MTRKRLAMVTAHEEEFDDTVEQAIAEVVTSEEPALEELEVIEEQSVIVPSIPTQEQPVTPDPEPIWIPVIVVSQAANGLWRLQWHDAVGRLHQSWSPIRLERSTLEHLASLPPHGDDFEAVVRELKIPVDELVATLHQMNVWEYHEITYPVLRDICAGLGRREFIQLDQRVQALNA